MRLKTMLFRSETSVLQRKGYTLGGDLGEGSYAKVKSATWIQPGTKAPVKVALKIINSHDVPADFKEKFLPRELDIMQLINHQNVIRTMEVFNNGKKTYIALEFAGHGDLLSYVQLRGPLKEHESAYFFKQMVAGLIYLHMNGVIHRDLKCENVLLNDKNNIKIADFGFARRISKNDLSSTFCGSAAYAAPEILQGVPYRGDIADNWSLGVILFVMNCGIMPYRDNNVRLLMLDQKLPLRYGNNLEKSLSEGAKDLMQGILMYELRKRLNLPKIRIHDWLNKSNDGPVPPPPPSSNQDVNVDSSQSNYEVPPDGSNANIAPSPQAAEVIKKMIDKEEL